jgi:hypothetical protein
VDRLGRLLIRWCALYKRTRATWPTLGPWRPQYSLFAWPVSLPSRKHVLTGSSAYTKPQPRARLSLHALTLMGPRGQTRKRREALHAKPATVPLILDFGVTAPTASVFYRCMCGCGALKKDVCTAKATEAVSRRVTVCMEP